jgi:UDP-N-acetylglucosamine 2-epimerase
VHGDTTTSSATALASFYARTDVAHIEAGLRTHNLHSPWPEEANRQITGRLTKWHFSPTPQAKDNLLAENIVAEQICVTGNTVVDALFMARDQITADPAREARLSDIIAETGFAYDACAAHYFGDGASARKFRRRLSKHLRRPKRFGEHLSRLRHCLSGASQPQCSKAGP